MFNTVIPGLYKIKLELRFSINGVFLCMDFQRMHKTYLLIFKRVVHHWGARKCKQLSITSQKEHQRNCNQLSTELSSLYIMYIGVSFFLSLLYQSIISFFIISIFIIYHLFYLSLSTIMYLSCILISLYLSTIYLSSAYHLSSQHLHPSIHPSTYLQIYICLSQSSLLFLKAFLIFSEGNIT